jgi:hypothetical protein
MQIITCKKVGVENSCYYRANLDHSNKCCLSCDYIGECFEVCELISGYTYVYGCNDNCMEIKEID